MPLPELADALSVVRPHLANIEKSIRDGWEKTREIPPHLSAALSVRSQASIAHDLIVEQASRNLNAQIFDLSGLKLFVIDERAAIRFKKLSEDYLSSNQPTKQVQSFRYQQSLRGVPSVMNLEAGYVLNSISNEIESINLTCPNGKGIYWQLSLNGEVHSTNIQDLFDSSANSDNDPEPSIWTPKKSGVIIPFSRTDEKDT